MQNGHTEKYQLLCLPYAGASETAYQKFQPHLPENIELVTFELPGKGSRIREKPLKNLHQMVGEIGSQFKTKVNKQYAIYGHSMGAMIGHLLVHWIREKALPMPEHLFISSYFAPSQHYDKKRRALSNEEFTEQLKKINGIPAAILNEPKLMDIFLPIIRADFDAIDTYRNEQKEPYDIPITFVYGSEERGLASAARDWKRESTGEVNFYRFEGDHFFIFQETQRLCNLINTTLNKLYAFEP